MSTTEQDLKRIQEKLQQLLKQHHHLQKENELIKTELDQLKKQTEEYNVATDRLKQQVEILKYTNGEMTDEERKQFEKRINGYLKEIDRCIAMLSS
jgi:hypothetical protein